MKNIIVICKKLINDKDFISIVNDFCRINNLISNSESGHVGNDNADIYVTLIPDLSSEYEHEELVHLKSEMGVAPACGVDIHIGHSENSDKLASDFVNNLISKIGGLIDNNV